MGKSSMARLLEIILLEIAFLWASYGAWLSRSLTDREPVQDDLVGDDPGWGGAGGSLVVAYS